MGWTGKASMTECHLSRDVKKLRVYVKDSMSGRGNRKCKGPEAEAYLKSYLQCISKVLQRFTLSGPRLL